MYLGINEELFCIQEGAKAHVDTPITFRQGVLYMDEEIGHWKDGGLDYTNIEWFDTWLLENDNYKRLFPEEKGMLVFRPRRRAKNYDEKNPYGNAMKNAANLNNTYLMIRNGESLYRVFSENIVILPRLFPLKKELQTLLDEMLEAQKNDYGYEKERKEKKFEDQMYEYKKRAVLMQGLIDRSEVFHPLPCKINIFDMEASKDMVNFIYDDEATLPSGRLSFKEWSKNLNSTITHGSRIMLTGEYEGGRKNYGDRIFYECNEYSLPQLPSAGIYEVEVYKEKKQYWHEEKAYVKIKDQVLLIREEEYTTYKNTLEDHGYGHDGFFLTSQQKSTMIPVKCKRYLCEKTIEKLTILYNPKDTVNHGSSGWGDYDPHERKKRIRWEILQDDFFVLHWDRLSIDDVDFYLTSRVDRPNYLDMMPVLITVKEHLQEEKEKEAPFIQFLIGALMPKLPELSEQEVETRVVKSVDWWKEKNMIKRSIDKDDVLAIRMIQKRVCSKNYEKLDWAI